MFVIHITVDVARRVRVLRTVEFARRPALEELRGVAYRLVFADPQAREVLPPTAHGVLNGRVRPDSRAGWVRLEDPSQLSADVEVWYEMDALPAGAPPAQSGADAGTLFLRKSFLPQSAIQRVRHDTPGGAPPSQPRLMSPPKPRPGAEGALDPSTAGLTIPLDRRPKSSAALSPVRAAPKSFARADDVPAAHDTIPLDALAALPPSRLLKEGAAASAAPQHRSPLPAAAPAGELKALLEATRPWAPDLPAAPHPAAPHPATSTHGLLAAPQVALEPPTQVQGDAGAMQHAAAGALLAEAGRNHGVHTAPAPLQPASTAAAIPGDPSVSAHTPHMLGVADAVALQRAAELLQTQPVPQQLDIPVQVASPDQSAADAAMLRAATEVGQAAAVGALEHTMPPALPATANAVPHRAAELLQAQAVLPPRDVLGSDAAVLHRAAELLRHAAPLTVPPTLSVPPAKTDAAASMLPALLRAAAAAQHTASAADAVVLQRAAELLQARPPPQPLDVLPVRVPLPNAATAVGAAGDAALQRAAELLQQSVVDSAVPSTTAPAADAVVLQRAAELLHATEAGRAAALGAVGSPMHAAPQGEIPAVRLGAPASPPSDFAALFQAARAHSVVVPPHPLRHADGVAQHHPLDVLPVTTVADHSAADAVMRANVGLSTAAVLGAYPTDVQCMVELMPAKETARAPAVEGALVPAVNAAASTRFPSKLPTLADTAGLQRAAELLRQPAVDIAVPPTIPTPLPPQPHPIEPAADAARAAELLRQLASTAPALPPAPVPVHPEDALRVHGAPEAPGDVLQSMAHTNEELTRMLGEALRVAPAVSLVPESQPTWLQGMRDPGPPPPVGELVASPPRPLDLQAAACPPAPAPPQDVFVPPPVQVLLPLPLPLPEPAVVVEALLEDVASPVLFAVDPAVASPQSRCVSPPPPLDALPAARDLSPPPPPDAVVPPPRRPPAAFWAGMADPRRSPFTSPVRERRHAEVLRRVPVSPVPPAARVDAAVWGMGEAGLPQLVAQQPLELKSVPPPAADTGVDTPSVDVKVSQELPAETAVAQDDRAADTVPSAVADTTQGAVAPRTPFPTHRSPLTKPFSSHKSAPPQSFPSHGAKPHGSCIPPYIQSKVPAQGAFSSHAPSEHRTYTHHRSGAGGELLPSRAALRSISDASPPSVLTPGASVSDGPEEVCSAGAATPPGASVNRIPSAGTGTDEQASPRPSPAEEPAAGFEMMSSDVLSDTSAVIVIPGKLLSHTLPSLAELDSAPPEAGGALSSTLPGYVDGIAAERPTDASTHFGRPLSVPQNTCLTQLSVPDAAEMATAVAVPFPATPVDPDVDDEEGRLLAQPHNTDFTQLSTPPLGHKKQSFVRFSEAVQVASFPTGNTEQTDGDALSCASSGPALPDAVLTQDDLGGGVPSALTPCPTHANLLDLSSQWALSHTSAGEDDTGLGEQAQHPVPPAPNARPFQSLPHSAANSGLPGSPTRPLGGPRQRVAELAGKPDCGQVSELPSQPTGPSELTAELHVAPASVPSEHATELPSQSAAHVADLPGSMLIDEHVVWGDHALALPSQHVERVSQHPRTDEESAEVPTVLGLERTADTVPHPSCLGLEDQALSSVPRQAGASGPGAPACASVGAASPRAPAPHGLPQVTSMSLGMHPADADPCAEGPVPEQCTAGGGAAPARSASRASGRLTPTVSQRSGSAAHAGGAVRSASAASGHRTPVMAPASVVPVGPGIAAAPPQLHRSHVSASVAASALELQVRRASGCLEGDVVLWHHHPSVPAPSPRSAAGSDAARNLVETLRGGAALYGLPMRPLEYTPPSAPSAPRGYPTHRAAAAGTCRLPAAGVPAREVLHGRISPPRPQRSGSFQSVVPDHLPVAADPQSAARRQREVDWELTKDRIRAESSREMRRRHMLS